MPKIKYLYSPFLNFIQRSLNFKDIPHESVVSTAVRFFDKESVTQAVRFIRDQLDKDGTILKERRSTINASVFVEDAIHAMKELDAKGDFPFKFTIYDPSETPSIPHDVFTSLTCKLNECGEKMNAWLDRCNASFVTKTWPTPSESLSIPLHVKEAPPEIYKSCQKQKEFLDSNGASGKVQKVVTRSDTLVLYVRTEHDAEAIANSIKSNSAAVVKVHKPKFLAVAKFVPEDTTNEEIESAMEGIQEAKRYGTSKSVKLTFRDKEALEKALKYGVYVGYCHIKVDKYVAAPLRCFKCQKFDHLQRDCPNNAKCSRCSGDHENPKDNPCVRDTKCANCSGKHPCYSSQCPVYKRQLEASSNKRKQ